MRKSKSRINEEEEIIIVNNNDIINDGDNNEDMIVKELTEIKNNYEEVTEKLEENQMEEYNDNEIHSKIFIDQFLNDPNSFKKQNNLINNNSLNNNMDNNNIFTLLNKIIQKLENLETLSNKKNNEKKSELNDEEIEILEGIEKKNQEKDHLKN